MRRARLRRTAMLPGDIFEQTLLGYALNLVTSGVIFVGHKHGIQTVDLLVRLLKNAPRRRNARDPRALGELEFIGRLKRLGERHGAPPKTPPDPVGPVAKNLRLVATTMGLSEVERQILQFAVACAEPAMQALVDDVPCRTPRAVATLIANASALEMSQVEAALKRKARLISTGLVTVNDESDIHNRLTADARLLELLVVDDLDANALMDGFVPAATAPTLHTADFPHLAAEIQLAVQLLRSALAAKRTGVNVLLYGPTGTGKSELARVLARELTTPLLVAGKEGDEGESPDAQERLTSLLLGNRILGESQGLLMFDEMEDIFEANVMAQFLGIGEKDQARMSKQWFNRNRPTNCICRNQRGKPTVPQEGGRHQWLHGKNGQGGSSAGRAVG